MLPTTIAFGAARKAIAVYSAWLSENLFDEDDYRSVVMWRRRLQRDWRVHREGSGVRPISVGESRERVGVATRCLPRANTRTLVDNSECRDQDLRVRGLFDVSVALSADTDDSFM